MYSRNSELEQGWVAYGGTLLVHRTMEMDSKGTLLCNEVNPSTLKVIVELCILQIGQTCSHGLQFSTKFFFLFMYGEELNNFPE